MSLTQKEIDELNSLCRKLRRMTIESLHCAASGHSGGALSIVEMLAVLYFKEMNVDPSNPSWAERDRFVLSKGHGCPSLYAVLAERGFFPTAELKNLRKPHSLLQGHPCYVKTPGLDMSSGSLGQGLGAAAGMAMYAKRAGKNFRTYCIMGDGESQEGEIWETAMSAAHYGLDRLTVLLDANRLQLDGPLTEIMNPGSFRAKFEAFGWHVLEVDGHDVAAIADALDAARRNDGSGKPTMIICHTIKGKGVSFMENQVGWHGKAPNDEEYRRAMAELKD